jgi:hypothetical protein
VLWAKRSEMIAPLTNLVGECGYSKSDKKLGKKKVLRHWNAIHQKAFDDVKAAIAKDHLKTKDYTCIVRTSRCTDVLHQKTTQTHHPHCIKYTIILAYHHITPVAMVFI